MNALACLCVVGMHALTYMYVVGMHALTYMCVVGMRALTMPVLACSPCDLLVIVSFECVFVSCQCGT